MKQQEDNKTLEINLKIQPKTGSERQDTLRKRYKDTWFQITHKNSNEVPLDFLSMDAALRNNSAIQRFSDSASDYLRRTDNQM